jgi:hypothetical protein
MKNRVINGAQVINQRGATVTANSGNSTPFCTDRWRATNSVTTATAFTLQQSSTAPAGFTKSLLATVTNNTSPDGEVEIFYSIEGYNVADMGFGAAGASTFTLSFWVNSSVTGTYGVGFESTSGAYNYVGTYTVNSANTWEQKTITVTGPTSGTFDKTNDRGLTLRFDLGSSSTYNQAAGSWVNSGSSKNRTSSCVQWVTNSGATFYITGVQLEKGSTATSFDYRPYGTELALCQRYYESRTTNGNMLFAVPTTNDSSRWLNYQFKVTKRANPTMTFVLGGSFTTVANSGADVDSFSVWSSPGNNNNYSTLASFTASSEL